MPTLKRTHHVVLALGVSQTLAWASSFYLPAMLAASMSDDLGIAPATVYAALSMALLISATISPWAGRLVDHHGGRPVLLVSNALFVLGLGGLAAANGLWSMLLAWMVIGLAMGCGLYDTAFATLVHLYKQRARPAISGITLVAGFASTVGWPLSALMESQAGWRAACVGWALLHLLLAAPLNALLPRQGQADEPEPLPVGVPVPPAQPAGEDLALPPTQASAAAAGSSRSAPSPARPPSPWLTPLLALIFACMGFVSASIATHLPALLQAGGLTLAAAVGLAALAGPSQVLGRVLELGVLQRYAPVVTARVAAAGHPLAALLLLLAGPVLALPFVLLHGLGNGIITIVKGTLPLAVFGARGYGARQGWLNLPGRVVSALSPWGFGVLMQHFGAQALWMTAAAGAVSLLLLQWLPRLQGTLPSR